MSRSQLIGGWHALGAAVEAGRMPSELWLDCRRRMRDEALIRRLAAAGVPVHECDREQLDLLVPGVRHQGVVARVPALQFADASLLRQPAPPDGLLLVLDSVQDPHNLGACIRTAEAAGATAVVIPKDRSAKLTATVVKVSAGSAHRVPVIAVANLARALADLKRAGWWCTGLDGRARATIHELDLTVPSAIVLGSEGSGMRRLVREVCDQLARIPMAGQVESLNVSVAAAVCLYEAVRQRRAR